MVPDRTTWWPYATGFGRAASVTTSTATALAGATVSTPATTTTEERRSRPVESAGRDTASGFALGPTAPTRSAGRSLATGEGEIGASTPFASSLKLETTSGGCSGRTVRVRAPQPRKSPATRRRTPDASIPGVAERRPDRRAAGADRPRLVRQAAAEECDQPSRCDR